MIYGLGDLGNSIHGVVGALLRGDDVEMGNFSDETLEGLFGVIEGLGAAPEAKKKARNKVASAIRNKAAKGSNIPRETTDLTEKALFEQRLSQLPADAQQKLRSGQWQLVPYCYYGVKLIASQNHADLFKSGDSTVIGITNVVQGRMPAEDYFLATRVRCLTATLTADTEADMQGAAWTKPVAAVVNGEWFMGQESTTYIDKSAASVFSHDNNTNLCDGEYILPTPKMFYPQRSIKVEFDFATSPAAHTAMRFEIWGVKTTKA